MSTARKTTGSATRFTQSEGVISALGAPASARAGSRAASASSVQTVLKVSSFTSIEPRAGALYPAVALQPLPIDDVPARDRSRGRRARRGGRRGAARARARRRACRARCSTRCARAPARSGCWSRGGCRPAWPRRASPSELGERVGETVGYAVRFDEAGGPNTRVRFMTEGLFVRRMLAAPALPGVAAVVLDELHERHVATDLALAWLRRLREADRPDLAVVAMSATLDADPIARLSRRRRRPQRGPHVRRRDRAPARARRSAAGRRRSAGAVRRVLRDEPDGDVLVFLPGAGEIRRAQAALAELPGVGGFAVLPLHGEMPLEEQTRAVRPGDRRKIILSTNVAESSVTIDGVVGGDRLGPGADRGALALDRVCRRWRSRRSARRRPPSAPAAPAAPARDARCGCTRATTSSSDRAQTLTRDRARRSRRGGAGARDAGRRRRRRARLAGAAARRRLGRRARAARPAGRGRR